MRFVLSALLVSIVNDSTGLVAAEFAVPESELRPDGLSVADLSRDALLEVPACPELWSPFLTVIPLQLLAYHVALRAGRDVDQPRNLAKSVTVE